MNECIKPAAAGAIAWAFLGLIVAPLAAEELKPIVLKGHTEEITALAFSTDGKTLATAADDDTVRVWDVESGKERLTLKANPRKRGLAFSFDGKILAAGWARQKERGVKIWDVTTGKELASLKHPEIVQQLTFSPDGKRLVAGGQAGAVTFWDAATYKRLGTVNEHESGLAAGYFLTSVVFSPDGKTLATAGYMIWLPFGTTRGELRLWDVDTLKERNRPEGRPRRVYTVAFSPDGKTIVAGTGSGVAHWRPPYGEFQVWDAATGQHREFTGEGRRGPVVAVAFRPDGKTLAAASERVEGLATKDYRAVGEVQLWDTEKWRVSAVLRGHRGGINSLAFTPDGRTLITSDGNDVRVWDAATKKEQAMIENPEAPPDLFALSPDGKRLATACTEFTYKDGTVRVWVVAKLVEGTSKEK